MKFRVRSAVKGVSGLIELNDSPVLSFNLDSDIDTAALDISTRIMRIRTDLLERQVERRRSQPQPGDVVLHLSKREWEWINAQPFDELPFWLRLDLRPDLYCDAAL